MKNHWMRFGGLTAITLAVCSHDLALAQQSVAPPTSGYGNQRSNNAPANPVGQPQNAPAGAQQPNPALNPAFNNPPNGAAKLGVGSGKEVVTKDPFADNPVTPQEQQYLDQILNYWEKSTAQIQQYSCKFKRWQYNSTENFVDQLAKQTGRDVRDVNTTTAAGELKFAAPDKGMYKIDILLKLTGQVANNAPEYKEVANQFGEWWLCDGKKVYDFDRTAKKCTQYTIPPEMQGAGILESPMPFVFGVKAEVLKSRYWLRPMPAPKDQTGKPRTDIYVIQAYPKFQADAVNYDHVEIYLNKMDSDTIMPVMLVRYNPEHVDKQGEVLNDNREVLEFHDRQKNATVLQKVGELFGKSFIPFNPPSDWKLEEREFAPAATEDIRSAAVPGALPPSNSAQPNSQQPNVRPR